VLEAGSGVAIPDVYVELIGEDGEAHASRLADSEGRFEFLGLPPGSYRVWGERLGYADAFSGFIALKADEVVAVDFRMATEAIAMDPLTVTASPRPWYEHLEPPALWEYYERREYLEPLGRGRFLGPEELKYLGGVPVSIAIATVPGMRAVPDEKRGSRFHVLGRRGCDTMFFLNGMEVKLRGTISMLMDTTHTDFIPGPMELDFYIDDLVAMNEVEAIEVYRGASELPGEFHGMHGGANCGAVVVWTKRGVEASRNGG